MLLADTTIEAITQKKGALDLKETLHEQLRGKYQDSLYEFIKAGWKYIDPNPFIDGWHLKAIAEHLQAVARGDIRRLIINQPPRTSKSSMLVAFDAWVWAQPWDSPTEGPGIQFLHASYAQTLSIRDSLKTRRLIESPWYQSYWGNKFKITSDQNTKIRFENDHGGYRLATSVGGALTGEGGSCFPAGTSVSTPSGLVPIEALKDGDEIFAFDHSRGKVVKSRVIATASRDSDDLYEIRTSSGNRFICTGNHPIFTPGRGYIRADQMGIGDGVIIQTGAIDNGSFDLRTMWQANGQKTLRFAKGAESRQQGRLLFQRMLQRTSINKKYQAVSNLWKSTKASAFPVLFGCLPSHWQRAKKKETYLPKLRDIVQQAKDLLFKFLCGSGSISTDDRDDQFAIQGIGQVFKPIQANGGTYSATGQSLLRGVWTPRQIDKWSQKNQKITTSGSPHRRKYAEQFAGEFDFALRFLPQKASSWDFDKITGITKLGSKSVKVHDIQVAEHSNFFAEGVLCHNCIIIDDPHNAIEMESELVREKTIEWFDNSLSTRLNNAKTGAMILVMQRLHEDDLTGHILARDYDDWTHLMLPMRADLDRARIIYPNVIGWSDPRTEDGELLCPDRFDEESVDLLERQLGPYGASGQLQQSPSPKGGGIIKRDYWEHWDAETFPPFEYILASVDTAYGTKQFEGDFSAITVWGVWRDTGMATGITTRTIGPNGEIVTNRVEKLAEGSDVPRIMLINAWQGRVEFHGVVEKIAEICRKFKVDTVLIENKAAGISVAQEIRRLYGHEDWGVLFFDPKSQDKVARTYSIQHLFAEGLIMAPQDRAWADMVITQCEQFPKAKHDDLVDTVTQALSWLRSTGMIERGVERTAALADQKTFRGNSQNAPLYPV